MAYKTYSQQQEEHIKYLRDKGFVIDELIIKDESDPFERCPSIDQNGGRSKLAYKSVVKKLDKGLTGITTIFRGVNGEKGNFPTYGLGPTGSEKISLPAPQLKDPIDSNAIHKEIAKKAYGFWEHSLLNGQSGYLKKKNVGSYDLRFRITPEYGTAAIVPMRDENGKIWNYQILNEDSSKRFHDNGKTEGLFHMLKNPRGSKYLGIAEGYATAATCMELTTFPIACAFSADNLKHVAVILRRLYPDHVLIIFADNDRHLSINTGLIEAEKAKNAVDDNAIVIAPDFLAIDPAKNANDFNDLVRLIGSEMAKKQIKLQILNR
jgi:hypothetical protein